MSAPNPYESFSAIDEAPKAHNRLWTYLDIAGIVCAALPFMFLASVTVLAAFIPGDEPPVAIGIAIDLLAPASLVLWLVGGIYNLISIIRGRRLPILGLLMNLLSLGVLLLFFFVPTMN